MRDIAKLKAAKARWYQKNRKRCLAKFHANRKIVVEYVWDLKCNSKCTRCSESDPACLDFHHRSASDKKDNVARLMGNGHSLKVVKEEIEKCDILCANCHRKLHFYEKDGRTLPLAGER